MKIYREESLDMFDAWGYGEETLKRVCQAGKLDELERILCEKYPEGIEEGELNQMLQDEADMIYGWLGMPSEKERIAQILLEAASVDESFSDFCHRFWDCERGCPLDSMSGFEFTFDCKELWKKWKEENSRASKTTSVVSGSGS